MQNLVLQVLLLARAPITLQKVVSTPPRSIYQGIGSVFEFLTRISIENKKNYKKVQKSKNNAEKRNKIDKTHKTRKL